MGSAADFERGISDGSPHPPSPPMYERGTRGGILSHCQRRHRRQLSLSLCHHWHSLRRQCHKSVSEAFWPFTQNEVVSFATFATLLNNLPSNHQPESIILQHTIKRIV
jgi:hypothetical protein